MNQMKNAKAIAVVSTALMVASIIWLMNTKQVNRSLETGLSNEKLKTEELLSEKLLLEKDIQKMKDELLSLNHHNEELDALLKSKISQLQNQENEYKRMKKENLTLAHVKKQRKELLAMQSQLQNELASLKNSYAELENKNSELNTTIASLSARNRILTDDLNRAMFVAVDQSQIQALKGKKEKLTVRARKTRKLLANFEVPSNLKHVTFRIKDSNGKIFSDQSGTIAYTSIPSDGNLTASSKAAADGNQLQHIQMTFTPKERLSQGVYTVELLNENLYVGSVKVKLN